MKFKARGASILALFPTACHPSGDFYVCPPRFPSLGNNPEMKSLLLLEVVIPPRVILHDTTFHEDTSCQLQTAG